MKTLPTYILTLCLLLAAASAQAGRTYKIEQDLGVGYQYVGTASAFTTSDTLADFYGYKMTGADNYGFTNTVVSLEANRSHLFLVEGSDGLGLFVVHNTMGSGGSGTAEMEMNFSTTTTITVEDDWDDHAWDEYASGEGSSILAQWQWSNKTDGLAVKLDNADHGDWMTIAFTDLSNVGEQTLDYEPISGLDTWAVIDSSNSLQELTLTTNAPVKLTLVPLPPAAFPAIGLLGIIGLKKWRSRRKARSL
jgi:hypothetical protein